MEIVRYKPIFKERWDSFVWGSCNGTIFHTQKFISYHPPDRFEDYSLLIRDGSEIVAVFPAAKMGGTLKSHPGTSFGGPVIRNFPNVKETKEILSLIVSFAEREGFGAIDMRLPPYIFHHQPCDEIDFIAYKLGFRLDSLEMTSAIPMENQIFRSDTERSIRKAHRGLTFKCSDEWERYWEILRNNLAYRHDAEPTHNLDEILKLKGLFPNKVYLFASYLGDIMTGGIVVFVCNDKTFHTFYHAQDYDYQNYRSLNLVIYELIKWGNDKKFKFMNLGISTENHGDIINWGLYRFKEGFGARGVLRKYYRLEL